MRLFLPLLLLAFSVLLIGCKRGGEPATEAEAGNYFKLGPIGLSVESVRLGKIRMRGMMGQDGESDKEVFTIKTRFKLFDTSTPVKQPVLHRDGMMFGGAGLQLKDENGRQFNAMGGSGFNSAVARRKEDAILTADKSEITDVLTFESTVGSVGNLTLEVKGDWQVQQPDGKFLQPEKTGTFRIRIPRSMWETPPPATEAGPGNWATVGPVSVAVESVRLGKVKMRGLGAFNQAGESEEPVMAIGVRVKLVDTKARVKKLPFVPDGMMMLQGPAVTLKSPQGEEFPVITGSGFNRIVGRQEGEVELSAEKPEVTDLLTFSNKAGNVDEVILTLWPEWQEQKPDKSWGLGPLEGEFRFRIPKAMWTK